MSRSPEGHGVTAGRSESFGTMTLNPVKYFHLTVQFHSGSQVLISTSAIREFGVPVVPGPKLSNIYECIIDTAAQPGGHS